MIQPKNNATMPWIRRHDFDQSPLPIDSQIPRIVDVPVENQLQITWNKPRITNRNTNPFGI